MHRINKKILIILAFLAISPMFLGIINQNISETLNLSNKSELNNKSEIAQENESFNLEEIPKISNSEKTEWWDVDFAYRRQLNISNPGSDNFIDNYASITFNYSELVNAGKMNESLKDVRIVENGQLREYYINQDYPENGKAQIWFETNCSASTTEYDTYMYYGNNTLDFASNKWDYNPMGVMWQSLDSIYEDTDTGIKYVNDSVQHNDGIIQGNPTIEANGKIGGALVLGGDNNPGAAVSGNLDAYLGRGYTHYFWGSIDDFRVYDESLSINEIQKVMNYNYTLDTVLNSEIEQGAQVTITVRDIDGKAVPNAEVSLYNTTGLAFAQYSDDLGIATFETIPYDYYNLTINYTLPFTGEEEKVFEGNATDGFIEFKGIYEETTIYCNLWTIDFDINDFDGEVMDYGYIEIYQDASKSNQLANLSIQKETGTQVFRWLNTTSYYYEVFYENGDYIQKSTLINQTTIERKDYAKIITYNMNQTSEYSFVSSKTIYANHSSVNSIGATKLINVSIQIRNITDEMNKIDIYYINTQKQNIKLNDISKSYSGSTTEDLIEFVLSDEYDAYGIVINIFGDNNTQNNGTVQVNLTQTTSQEIIADMSKVSIRVLDDNAVDPVSSVSVQIYDGNVESSNSLVNLTTNNDGYAHGIYNSDLEFWYLRGTYNFTLEFFGSIKEFKLNETNPEQWEPSNFITVYNYSVNEQSTLDFALKIDSSEYISKLETLNYTPEVAWGENMRFSVNFTTKAKDGPYNAVTDPDQIDCLFSGSIDKTINMIHTGFGIFNVTVNSSIFPIGTSQSILTIKISGYKIGYTRPDPILLTVIINPVAMEIALHDYTDENLPIIENKTISQYYDEVANFSISYYNEGDPNSRISEATLNFYWDKGSESGVVEDPLNPGYYTFSIDTSDAPNIGKYSLYVSVSLENHTYETLVCFIQILPRPTKLNSTLTDPTTELLRISVTVNQSDPYLFNFTYINSLSSSNIINASIAKYDWEYTTENTKGTGILTPLGSNYQLDFNTSSLEVGNYLILVTIKELNYEQRQAMIIMEITKRVITYNLEGDISTGQFFSDRGSDWNLSVQLFDTSRFYISLLDANVSLSFSSVGEEYILIDDNDNGIYNYTVIWDDVDDIFTNDSYVGRLKIEKETFETIFLDVIFVVKNRTILLDYEGDFSGAQIIRYHGDQWDLSIRLIDSKLHTPIIGANVVLSFDSKSFTLEDINNDGYYSYIVVWNDVKDIFTNRQYLAELHVEKETYSSFSIDISVILNERIIDFTYSGDFQNAQVSKDKGDQWNLTIELKDTSRYFMSLLGTNVTLSFPELGHSISLIDQNNGFYTAIVQWNDVKDIFNTAESYQGQLIIEKETFAPLYIDISLIIKDRIINLEFQGNFEGNNEIVRINGEEFTFSVNLQDNLTNTALLNATVTIVFDEGKGSITLLDENNDGIYTATKIFTDDEVSAFFQKDSFQGTLKIEADNYATIEKSITVIVKITEISDGIPTFYVLIAIGGLLILVGTLGGYKLVQTARIPAFIKIIDKVIKNVKGDKTISDENITLSAKEELVDKLGDKWKLLDLNLAEILGISKESEITGVNLATGEEATGGV